MDLYVKRHGSTINGDISKDGENYICEMGGIPNIGYKDELFIKDGDHTIQLRVRGIQTITYKGNRGTRIIMQPILFEQQEVKTLVDVYQDGDTFLVKFPNEFEVTDPKGGSIHLSAAAFEIKAKQTKGAK